MEMRDVTGRQVSVGLFERLIARCITGGKDELRHVRSNKLQVNTKVEE